MVKVTRSVIFGKRRAVEAQAASLRRADGKAGQINTAYIERDNLTLRQEVHRLARKTLGFSKNRRELQHALDFIDAHDNFIKPHRALRTKAFSKGNPVWIPRTPVMAAGISHHIWTLEELLLYKTYLSIYYRVTTGTNESMKNSLNICSRGGKVIVVGYTDQTFEGDFYNLLMHEKEIIGTRASTKYDLALAVDLVEKNLIKPYVSDIFKFDDINIGLKHLKDGNIMGRGVLLL